MSSWQFLGNLVVSDQGKTIQRVIENTSISSDGMAFSKFGKVANVPDGAVHRMVECFALIAARGWEVRLVELEPCSATLGITLELTKPDPMDLMTFKKAGSRAG